MEKKTVKPIDNYMHRMRAIIVSNTKSVHVCMAGPGDGGSSSTRIQKVRILLNRLSRLFSSSQTERWKKLNIHFSVHLHIFVVGDSSGEGDRGGSDCVN